MCSSDLNFLVTPMQPPYTWDLDPVEAQLCPKASQGMRILGDIWWGLSEEQTSRGCLLSGQPFPKKGRGCGARIWSLGNSSRAGPWLAMSQDLSSPSAGVYASRFLSTCGKDEGAGGARRPGCQHVCAAVTHMFIDIFIDHLLWASRR